MESRAGQAFVLCLLVLLSSLGAGVTASRAQQRNVSAQPAQTGHRGEAFALVGILESQLKQKQHALAQQTVQKLRNLLQPRDPLYLKVATVCAIHEEYGLAIPLMENLRAAFPQSYDVSYNLALAYLRNKSPVKATEALQLLLRHQPRAEAYNLLAMAHENQKQYLEAVRSFKKAAEMEPGNEDYRYDYAFELLKHKTDNAAVAIFLSGVRDFPHSVKMKLGLGCTYHVVGKNEDAAQVLLDVVKIEPRNKLAYTFLGRTYEQAGSFQPAVAAAFREYVQQEPRDAWAYYHFGRILYLTGMAASKTDFKEAKFSLQRAVSLKPGFAEAFVQLAILSQAEDEVQESLALLNRAVQSNPKLAAAHYRLGIVYKRLGQEDKAAAEFALSERLNAEDQARRDKHEVIQFLVEQGT